MLVYLLVTGVPLQFSAELRLGQRHVGAAWVLDWYGLRAPDRVRQSGEVVQVGQQLFFAAQTISTSAPMVGAISLTDFVIIAAGDELLVVPRDVAASPETTNPGAAIKRIGSWRGTPYVETDAGLLAADALLINWQPAAPPPGEIVWATTGPVSDPDAAIYRDRFRLQMLTAERWLQDLHSGRFFGTIGVLVVDLAATLLLILAATGLLLWWRFRRA